MKLPYFLPNKDEPLLGGWWLELLLVSMLIVLVFYLA